MCVEMENNICSEAVNLSEQALRAATDWLEKRSGYKLKTIKVPLAWIAKEFNTKPGYACEPILYNFTECNGN